MGPNIGICIEYNEINKLSILMFVLGDYLPHFINKLNLNNHLCFIFLILKDFFVTSIIYLNLFIAIIIFLTCSNNEVSESNILTLFFLINLKGQHQGFHVVKTC